MGDLLIIIGLFVEKKEVQPLNKLFLCSTLRSAVPLSESQRLG